MTKSIQRARRQLAGTLATGGLAVVLAACGASPGAGGVTTLQSDPPKDGSAAPSASLDPEEAALAFARCMREHGIDLPDPDPNGGLGGVRVDVDPGQAAALQEAQEACHRLLGITVGGPASDPVMQDRLLAFARCMREQGVDYPDPLPDGGMVVITVDPTSPVFHAAQEACRAQLGGEVPVFAAPEGVSGGGVGEPRTPAVAP